MVDGKFKMKFVGELVDQVNEGLDVSVIWQVFEVVVDLAILDVNGLEHKWYNICNF